MQSSEKSLISNLSKLFIIAVYEKDKSVIINICHFIDNAILSTIDYLFVINGTISFMDKLQGIKAANVDFISRENRGYDFGAYEYGLHTKASKTYDYYFFINSSSKGPFIPPYVNKTFDEIFISQFKNDVHLVSPTIILLGNNLKFNDTSKLTMSPRSVYPICQSYMFVLDRCGMEILQKYDFFNTSNVLTHLDACYKECLMSCLLLQEGANIGCLMPEYQNVDFRYITKQINDYQSLYPAVNPIEKNLMFNDSMHPYEVVFHKNNRNLNDSASIRYGKSKYVNMSMIRNAENMRDPLITSPSSTIPSNNELITKYDHTQITKVLYGISETKNIDVTDKVIYCITKNVIIGKNFNVSKYFSDPYPRIPKKLMIYIKNNTNPIIINECQGKLIADIRSCDIIQK